MLFGHGDDFYNYQQEVRINFSSNVWHGANLDKLIDHLNTQFNKITRYPDPDAASLKRILARRFELKEENVVVTNGSVTAFYLLAQAWKGARSLIFEPTFSEYEDACRLHEHTITYFSNSEDLTDLSLKDQDFCWICNPNNPDGKFLHRTELLKLIAANKQTTFIIDQAYAAFTTEDILKPSDLKANKNLVLVQSISKAYNIPGLRIGYIMASPSITKTVNKYLIPWSVNALAIEASKYILIHPAQFTLPIRKWQRETAELIYQLSKLDGLEVIPSSTTFFLVRLKKGTAADLKKYLLDTYGILIRDASNFHGLDETYFRLSSQLLPENQELINGIKEWLDKQ
ncbi:threonine-phosphate decarboxylase [Parabacteroides sp. PF5-5]|uniref:aminotransferase class I/II-fold pyridoxal phosphate-dependent enzyme n=1 Tax=unclassified Parabacteroides TaxID=2649774 RepID=UPI002475ABF4|nr:MULTISPECIES: aminotransferase class I/II-fold pyridoxal phosphate-dependent enzyme [unclassified Parabacteroides]MDH6305464.1 threonine-phosphate decarboxylase [Parabacteroides sp. PH5-39]MDH6316174.1 threonine-phosphate decarboxylase [Parabacteroides sp. PF5-13]MDH6320324.1 threonine-phosphate decarboxylase [Parabacteroides sp. PH5-13]MDH6324054.1 threonine-phosphate decarboxylase [Parabacteroides sp. PH5-8]MDH6327365.1 threonine-phosphate decarboxylase [Parabacteroides sp. PH5-41]